MPTPETTYEELAQLATQQQDWEMVEYWYSKLGIMLEEQEADPLSDPFLSAEGRYHSTSC